MHRRLEEDSHDACSSRIAEDIASYDDVGDSDAHEKEDAHTRYQSSIFCEDCILRYILTILTTCTVSPSLDLSGYLSKPSLDELEGGIVTAMLAHFLG